MLPDGTTGYTGCLSKRITVRANCDGADAIHYSLNITIPATAVSVSIGTDGTVTIYAVRPQRPCRTIARSTSQFHQSGRSAKHGAVNLFLETALAARRHPYVPGTNGVGLQSGLC